MEIEITKIDNKLFVSYQVDGSYIEGKLIPFNTGRGTDYKFEANWFEGDQSAEYYDNNYEQINSQIITKFNELNL